MRFTVLVPTHDHGRIIRHAIASVRRQTVADWELFVVADGAPAETLDLVDTLAAEDRRIRLFRFPKGLRHGEASRHVALQEATGTAVCYLGDDDIWFPHHLATMAGLLATADFAHTRQTAARPDFVIGGLVGDLGDASIRARMTAEAWNFFGPTVVGHRLDAYRRLPVGWSPAPAGVWSDLSMWRKWFAADGMRFRSSPAVTTLKLPSPGRGRWSLDERDAETAFYARLFSAPSLCAALEGALPAGRGNLPLADFLLGLVDAARAAD